MSTRLKRYLEFSKTTNHIFKKNQALFNKISEEFKFLKNEFNQNGLKLKKIGEFAYGTYYENENEIVLELVGFKFLPSIIFSKKDYSNLFLKSLNKIKNSDQLNSSEKGVYKYQFDFQKYKITFNIFESFITKTKKETFFYLNYEGNFEKDKSLEVTNSIKKANKISKGIIFSLKKIMKYITKNQYSYDFLIDILILRWFNEFLSRNLTSYIDRNFYDKKNDQWHKFNPDKFMSVRFLSSWLTRSFSYNELITYILTKLWFSNTYYFGSFTFEEEEVFANVSRYSLNTNANFLLPKDFYSDIKIFDFNNYESLRFYQNNISSTSGLSKIAFDDSRNNAKRYCVSPIISTGYVNYSMYKTWLTKKIKDLYYDLSEDIRKDIKRTRQRESMETLNLLTHKWLSTMRNKFSYLIPYFDPKYPFWKINNLEDLITTIMSTVDSLNDADFLLGYDN